MANTMDGIICAAAVMQSVATISVATCSFCNNHGFIGVDP